MINIHNIIELQQDKPNDMIISGQKRNTKLMFHKIEKSRQNIDPKYNLKNFEQYQKEHHNVFFAATEYVLSFWYEGKIARFLGCYKLNRPVKDKVKDESGKARDRYFFPDMEKIDFLSEYDNRLYITWTNPSANYGRFIDDDKFEIHSIIPSKNNSIGAFPNEYFKIRLSYYELRKMMDYPIDNNDWYNYLSNHKGVYIVYDKSSFEQYIGSAYGEKGFWGRWSDYARQNDGNKGFNGKDYNNFQFSIVWETLLSTDKDKILNVEAELKKSLGTRVHGLNN